MPLRRSCFEFEFLVDDGAVPSFNATTAFLLRYHPPSPSRSSSWFQCHHSVPASVWPAIWAFPQIGFQCNHGVPASRPAAGAVHIPLRVSMPPRRSCFESAWAPGLGLMPGFNATTAFLLHMVFTLIRPSPGAFNATTAFLLQRDQLDPRAQRANFQCHHGVPASR